MALPASGAISLNDVNVELDLPATAQISLNDAAVRGLFEVASGAINMANGYGKANQFEFTVSTNQTNADLATLATSAGWDGQVKLVAVVDSGIYISSDSTAVPALTVGGLFPNGIELTNNGYIVGRGGNAGNGASTSTFSVGSGGAGLSGGLALSAASAVSITNNGTIAGGGGGGGGGGGIGGSNPSAGDGKISTSSNLQV